MGLLRLRLPEEYGGQGYSFVDCGIVCEEIGRCDHQIRYIISNAIHLGEMASSIHPDLQEEWIPRIANGEMMSLAFTEPRGGADAGNITTKAVKDGDHWVITGEKTSITFTGVSKVVFVSARTGKPGPRGLSFFLLPDRHPGRQGGAVRAHGPEARPRRQLLLRRRAHPRAQHGRQGKRRLHLGDGRSSATTATSCRWRASAQRMKSLEETTEYAEAAPDHGQADVQVAGRRHRARAAQTQLEAARMLCYRALWMKDQGMRHDAESSMAKWWGVKVANEALYTCMRLNGHYGWAKALPLRAAAARLPRHGVGRRPARGSPGHHRARHRSARNSRRSSSRVMDQSLRNAGVAVSRVTRYRGPCRVTGSIWSHELRTRLNSAQAWLGSTQSPTRSPPTRAPPRHRPC